MVAGKEGGEAHHQNQHGKQSGFPLGTPALFPEEVEEWHIVHQPLSLFRLRHGLLQPFQSHLKISGIFHLGISQGRLRLLNVAVGILCDGTLDLGQILAVDRILQAAVGVGVAVEIPGQEHSQHQENASGA